MTQQEKIEELQSILKQRLPYIKRWKWVRVYSYETCPAWIISIIGMKKDEVTIHWGGERSRNIHDDEFKTVKATDLDERISINRKRLKSKRPIYK